MTKVKFGVSKAEYGVVQNDLVPDESKKLPGMTAAKLEITADIASLSADDGPYVTLSGGITEAKLTLNNYDINADAQKDFYGVRTVKGVSIYKKDLVPNDISLMFRTKDEEGKGIWFALLKAKYTMPGVDTKTVDGTPDPTADEIVGTGAPRGDADEGNMILIGRESDPEFSLDQFKTWVFPKTEDDALIPDDLEAEPVKLTADATATVKEGETVKITATVTPTGTAITYKSADEATATVAADGTVTGVKAGNVDVTATAGGQSATTKVTVTAADAG